MNRFIYSFPPHWASLSDAAEPPRPSLERRSHVPLPWRASPLATPRGVLDNRFRWCQSARQGYCRALSNSTLTKLALQFCRVGGAGPRSWSRKHFGQNASVPRITTVAIGGSVRHSTVRHGPEHPGLWTRRTANYSYRHGSPGPSTGVTVSCLSTIWMSPTVTTTCETTTAQSQLAG